MFARLVFFGICTLSTVQHACAQTPSDFVKIIREGETKLIDFESHYNIYECRHDAKSPPEQNSTVYSNKSTRLTATRRADMLLLEMHASPNVTSVKAKSPPIAKSCFTDQYFFTILGTNGAELWTLAKFSRSNPRQLFDDSLAGRFEVVYPLRTFAATWTISDVLKSGDFVVSAVRKGVNGCLEGDYSATVTRGKDSLVLDGTCIIDPSHHGLVIENRYTLSATNFYRTTMRRKINIIDDKIVCNTLSTESKDVAKGTIEFTDLYTFDKYTANTPDKVIFTLEHYGIPTPDDDLVPWYSRWKVWALLAVFGMMLAVLFRRLAVRRRVR